MAEGSIQRLLTAIWGNRKGFVFIPHKDLDRRWNETPGIPYSGEVSEIEDLPRGDVYFCPVVFSEPKRKKEFAQSTNVLWADLDPVHPESCRVRPSIAWESSPGRYQALWFLTSEITAEDAAGMSKRIAYADGADKGGWDVTQVLRLPGTKNYKYPSTPDVHLLWAKRVAYSVDEILAAYPPVNGKHEHEEIEWEEIDEAKVNLAVSSLPIGLRRRLMKDPKGADRSLELQKLARDLLRFGVAPDITVHLLQRSTFNKFAGRADEKAQLLKQVDSAISAIEKKEAGKTSPEARGPLEEMKVHSWASFLQQTTHLRWLIDDAWVDQTVGFISGRSKSYKTWIALDLALSLISGAPFLGRYPVRRTGPVLLIQEEDPASILQDRLRIIAKNKGMLPQAEITAKGEILLHFPEFPLHIINLQGFSLGAQEKVDQVRRLIAEINPVMVILDPLVVMMGSVDEYKASEVAIVLQSVKMWREEFGCSVIIVHHWNKSKMEDAERGGQHMYGSFAFHAWLESAIHVMPVIDEDQERIDTVIVEREFKAAPSSRTLKLKFQIDTAKDYRYEVKFEDDKSITARGQQIIDLLASAGGGLTTPELVAMTGFPRPKLVEEMGHLVRLHVVNAKRGGGRGKSTKYWLPDQPEPSD